MSKENKPLRVFVKRFVNPVLRMLTTFSRGPFALLRHTGRRSGKTYEIPMMVWPVHNGFVISLTYGPQVDWLRNLQAAEQGTLRWHKREYTFKTPVFISHEEALPALPPFIRGVLKRNSTHEFVKLVSATKPV